MPGFRAQFLTYALAMMADNIEHVISYWMVFQKFQSPALAGFAVLSHWLPFLLFSVAAGALADRFDPRRLIQCGMGLFIAGLARLGLFLHHRHPADVARHGAAGDPRLRRRAVADARTSCCSTTSSAPPTCRARCGSTPPRAISACWSARRWAA